MSAEYARSEDGERLEEENLGANRFVPLVGAAVWTPDGTSAQHDEPGQSGRSSNGRPQPATLPELIAAVPFDDLEEADFAPPPG